MDETSNINIQCVCFVFTYFFSLFFVAICFYICFLLCAVFFQSLFMPYNDPIISSFTDIWPYANSHRFFFSSVDEVFHRFIPSFFSSKCSYIRVRRQKCINGINTLNFNQPKHMSIIQRSVFGLFDTSSKCLEFWFCRCLFIGKKVILAFFVCFGQKNATKRHNFAVNSSTNEEL